MSVKGRVVTEGEVSQTIDLEKYIGRVARIAEIKETFIQSVIDQIVKRTESAKDVDGRPFKKYSDYYKNSLAYKVYGKTGTVNMQLTGDMLGSLDTIDEHGSQVTIGITGDENIMKAFAHVMGREGDSSINMPRRDFFGVTEKELQAIADQLKPDLNTKVDPKSDALTTKILNILSSGDGQQDEG
jgi:phage gpG-like protein